MGRSGVLALKINGGAIIQKRVVIPREEEKRERL